MRDIKGQLHVVTVDPNELAQVMLEYFGRAENSAPFEYQFSRQDQPPTVTLTVTKKGRLRAIRASEDLPDSDVQGLADQIRRKLLEDQVVTAGWGVLFCVQHRVNGYFQYRGRFQIQPAPPDAPRPPYVVGDHPFVLLFPYVRSPDPFLSMRRERGELVRLGRYLNLLLNPPIHSGSRYAEWGWVPRPKEPGQSDFLQLGYQMPAAPEAHLPLAAPQEIPLLPRVPSEEYYRSSFSGVPHELNLPDNIEASLDRLLGLTGDDRARLDRAASWLSQTHGIWKASGSGSYAALVIAIEALLEPIDPENCEACGQPKYAVNQRFKEFLRGHVPGIDKHPRVRDRLYAVRSDIVHGSEVFEEDTQPWRLTPSPRSDDERELNWAASRIVRTAVYNWLWSSDRKIDLV